MISSINIIYKQYDDLIQGLKDFAIKPANQMLVQIFTGILDTIVIEALLAELKKLLPGTPIIGLTTAGEIVDGRSLENTIVINITSFDDTTVKSFLVTENDDLEWCGREIGKNIKTDNIKAAIVLGCGLKDKHTINATEMLKALQKEIPGVTISGAQAGDNGKGQITYAFTEGGITSSGIAAASLSSDSLIVNTTYNLSWIPIGKKMTITKAKGSRVYEIDNMPPYEIYKHYLGKEVVDGLPLSAADFHLIIERGGMIQAIHATGVNEDGSFNFIHNFTAGEQIKFGYCHVGLLAVEANRTYKVLGKKEVDVAFVYSCVSRKWVLGADIGVELTPIADIGRSAGFYSYGEYFTHDTGEVLFLGQTMTVLTLAERSGDILSNNANKRRDCLFEETRQFKTLRVLHRLVEKSAQEIELMNIELASLVHKDSLTSLGNRRKFDSRLEFEINRHAGTGRPISIIMLDIDYFKNYNDTYGHVAGDNCLRGIGQTIKKIVNSPNDISSRYGGEEFAIILPETGLDRATTMAEQLRAEIEALGIAHCRSKVAEAITASFGVLTMNLKKPISPETAIEQCDRMLYKAKSEGRNRVASGNFK